LLIKGFTYFLSKKKGCFQEGCEGGKLGQSDVELSSCISNGMMSKAKPMEMLNTESKPVNI